MLSVAAASVGPVLPAETSASARPSATARAAWTIEASGLERTARTGSSLAVDAAGRVHDLDPVAELARRGRTRSTRTPERRAPSATARRARASAPFASSAITASSGYSSSVSTGACTTTSRPA